MGFSERARVFDLMKHVVDVSGLGVVHHTGKIKDALPHYKHWATEMLEPGWYILWYDDDENEEIITGVSWITSEPDDFVALAGAMSFIAHKFILASRPPVPVRTGSGVMDFFRGS